MCKLHPAALDDRCCLNLDVIVSHDKPSLYALYLHRPIMAVAIVAALMLSACLQMMHHRCLLLLDHKIGSGAS